MTRRPFGAEDARRLRLVRDAGFVPDSRRAYYTVAAIDDEGRRETHSLWLFERDGSAAHRIGEELEDLHEPTPSPDGRVFAVLADVAEKRQVCLVPLDGG